MSHRPGWWVGILVVVAVGSTPARAEAESIDVTLSPAAIEEMTLDEAEKFLIQKALTRQQGNVSRAADVLGLSRSALYRRLQHHGIANE